MFVWSDVLRGLGVAAASGLATWTVEDGPLASTSPYDKATGDIFFEGSEGSSDSYSYS